MPSDSTRFKCGGSLVGSGSGIDLSATWRVIRSSRLCVGACGLLRSEGREKSRRKGILVMGPILGKTSNEKTAAEMEAVLVKEGGRTSEFGYRCFKWSCALKSVHEL